MRVIFCLGSLNKGGAERVVCNLANYFVDKGDDVSIVITKPCRRAYRINKKIKVVVLDHSEKKRAFRNIRRILILRSIIIEYKPDVVFGFLQEPIARLLVLKVFCGVVRKIPTIISVRIDPKVAFKSFKQRLFLPFYNMAEGHVFQTADAKKFFNKAIQERGVIIANPVDPSFFINSIDNKKYNNKIISVGRLTQQKNYPMLIKAFSTVHNTFPDYCLEIYGEGVLKNSLKDLINSLGLKNSVILKGTVDDLKNAISDASLFVMTSDYEGMSNALMEAMALGLPCIVTNSAGGGAEALIKDGFNGFLVDVNDVNGLARRIIEVLPDSNLLKMISRNSVESMNKYSPDIINSLWYNYAMHICKGGSNNGKHR